MSTFDTSYKTVSVANVAQNSLIRSVFNWMTIGLLATALVAFYVSSNTLLLTKILNSGTIILLFVVEIGLVIWLSTRIMYMSANKATTLFLTYSALNGLTLAPIVLLYTGESIASTFVITAGVFGSMSFYGYTTKRDLTGMGSFMIMGLWGIILSSLVNLFLHSNALNFAISVIGVVIFTGLAAFDVQRIKQMSGNYLEDQSEDFKRMAIIGALMLYLDFINLFLHLLRFLGNRRN